MLATTPSVPNTGRLLPYRLLHPDWNKPVSIASWHNYMTLGLFAHHPFHPHLPLPEHPFPVLSSLVQVDRVGHSGLVRVPIIKT